MVFAGPSLIEELYGRSFFIDFIDLVIVSSVRDVKIDRKTCDGFSLTLPVPSLLVPTPDTKGGGGGGRLDPLLSQKPLVL